MKLWNGFEKQSFIFEGHEAVVVLPKKQVAGAPVAVKTEYWDAFPQAAEIDLLKNGFYICFIVNDNRWGIDEDLDRKARFIRFVQNKYNCSSKCVPVGMSCGGLIAIKLAARYPEIVSCLYLDAPVVNYMSCPCGFGVGNSLNDGIPEILNALKLNSLSELLAYREMPLDKLPQLVSHKIPIVLVAGDSDNTVPFCENGVFIERAYKAVGLEIEVYIKPGCDHHPHGLADNSPVISFILKHQK